MNNDQEITPVKEIIRYISTECNGRRYIIGAMVAFKRDIESNKFYIGFSLKHKDDWAIYDDVPSAAYVIEDEETGEEIVEYDYNIIGSIPFNKSIALETARSRAINWTMEPCEAMKIIGEDEETGEDILESKLPESIRNEFILFLDRAVRYFKINEMPEWIPEDINNEHFKTIVESIYTKRDRKKINKVKSLKSERIVLITQLENVERQIMQITNSKSERYDMQRIVNDK
jgi:hypothetical protein